MPPPPIKTPAQDARDKAILQKASAESARDRRPGPRPSKSSQPDSARGKAGVQAQAPQPASARRHAKKDKKGQAPAPALAQSPKRFSFTRSASNSSFINRRRNWFARWHSKNKLTKSVLSQSAASASLLTSQREGELSDTVHAAAAAAAEHASALGMAEDDCLQFYNSVVQAAAHAIELGAENAPGAAPAAGNSSSNSITSPVRRGAERIEAVLARAIRKSAVRVVDLFNEWDADRSGAISKKELRNALRDTGISATPEEVDRLFAKWDKDHSGGLDYNELSKALKTAHASKEASSSSVEKEAESVVLLGRGTKAAAVKQAKEAKEAAKEARMALSPRSQALRDAALAAEAEKREALAKAWAEDEESGRRWSIGKWLASRDVANVVASALQPPAPSDDAQSEFAYVKRLGRERVAALLESAQLGGLVEFVCAQIDSLSGQSTGSAENLNDKFASTAKFQMTYGSLSLFYGGLESLLGPPKMYKGPQHAEKSLYNSMEFEHLHEKDHDVTFTAPNGVTTTAETEWGFVCTPNERHAGVYPYPERKGYVERCPEWCRVPKPLEQMLTLMEESVNEKLRSGGHSEMILEELIGGRLYTGPMYIKYNTVLRSKTKDPHMMKLVKELTRGNGYATSIHAINSCVIKLSKLTKAGKVWRGIKGATLPKEFWVANEYGVRGGIEYGFSSTTTEREQALIFAGGGEQQEASTIFEMQMGMVDRGADLMWLSQYPHEQEVLLPPLTGIEALHVQVDSAMLVIHSRLSLNLASHTLEQVLSRRRKMLLDMILGIELELRDQLGDSLITFGLAVLKRALSYGPLSKDPEWFNDDENFSAVMQQTLQLQHSLVTQIHKLNVEAPELHLRGWGLRGSARVLLLAGWCYHRVASSTGSSVHEALSIDLRDSHLSTSEATQLAELMAKQPRLTALDVRGNETIGRDGAEALASLIEATRGVGVVARSVCGVTPNSSTLEVGRAIEYVERRLVCSELRTFVWAEGVTAGMGMAPRKDRPITLNRRGAFAANEWQPLLWAAKENHLSIATMLIDLGVDVNEQQPATGQLSQRLSALHVAAQKGNIEMCELLLQRGADRTMRDKHNNTALNLAEKKKHEQITALLRAADAGYAKLSA